MLRIIPALGLDSFWPVEAQAAVPGDHVPKQVNRAVNKVRLQKRQGQPTRRLWKLRQILLKGKRSLIPVDRAQFGRGMASAISAALPAGGVCTSRTRSYTYIQDPASCLIAHYLGTLVLYGVALIG